jgi:hypothetical protein
MGQALVAGVTALKRGARPDAAQAAGPLASQGRQPGAHSRRPGALRTLASALALRRDGPAGRARITGAPLPQDGGRAPRGRGEPPEASRKRSGGGASTPFCARAPSPRAPGPARRRRAGGGGGWAAAGASASGRARGRHAAAASRRQRPGGGRRRGADGVPALRASRRLRVRAAPARAGGRGGRETAAAGPASRARVIHGLTAPALTPRASAMWRGAQPRCWRAQACTRRAAFQG